MQLFNPSTRIADAIALSDACMLYRPFAVEVHAVVSHPKCARIASTWSWYSASPGSDGYGVTNTLWVDVSQRIGVPPCQHNSPYASAEAFTYAHPTLCTTRIPSRQSDNQSRPERRPRRLVGRASHPRPLRVAVWKTSRNLMVHSLGGA